MNTDLLMARFCITSLFINMPLDETKNGFEKLVVLAIKVSFSIFHKSFINSYMEQPWVLYWVFLWLIHFYDIMKKGG